MVSPLDQLADGPTFIVGFPRSGTTWTYEMLTEHQEVAGVFESHLFWVLTDIFSDACWPHGRIFGREAGLAQLMSFPQFLSDVRALTSRWLARALEPQHRFLIEKTPGHAFNMLQISSIYPRARFVHVVRDGRDAVASYLTLAHELDERMEPAHRLEGEDIQHWAQAWRRTVEVSREQSDQLGDRYVEVRYEGMRADPEAALSSLFEFCAVPQEPAAVRAIISRTALPGPDAGRRGLAGGWRTRWTRDDGEHFEAAAGDMLRALAYEDSRDWWKTLPPAR